MLACSCSSLRKSQIQMNKSGDTPHSTKISYTSWQLDFVHILEQKRKHNRVGKKYLKKMKKNSESVFMCNCKCFLYFLIWDLDTNIYYLHIRVLTVFYKFHVFFTLNISTNWKSIAVDFFSNSIIFLVIFYVNQHFVCQRLM